MSTITAGPVDLVYTGATLSGTNRAICRMSDTRVLMAYRDPTSGYLKLRCLDVVGDTVTHAGAVLAANTVGSLADNVIRLTDTLAVVLHRRVFTASPFYPNVPYALLVSIDAGGTITTLDLQTPAGVEASRSWGVRLTDSTFVVFWVRTSDKALLARMYSASAWLTASTYTDIIETSLAGSSAGFIALSATQVLAAYHYDDATAGSLIRGRVLGTADIYTPITTTNPPVTIETAVPNGWEYEIHLANFGGGEVGVFYLLETSFYIGSRILTVAGSSVSASSLTTHSTLGDTAQRGYSAALIPGTTDVMLAFATSGADVTNAVILSGTSLTYGAVFGLGDTGTTRLLTAPLTSAKTLVSKRNSGDRNAFLLLHAPPVTEVPMVEGFPMLLVEAYAGGTGIASLPMFVVEATGGPRNNGADITLPMFSAEARSGARADVALPMFTVEATATVIIVARHDASLPMLLVEALASVTTRAGADISLPMFTVEAYSGAVMDALLPMLLAEAVADVGSVGRADVTLPMLLAEALASMDNMARADIVLPMLVEVPSGYADILLPMLQVEAYVRIVVAITYEAYAVNLKPGENMPHQVTRYTGMPFSSIVRYQGNYYGWGPAGLYLLGGDLDGAAKIAWEFKTGITDFASSQEKVVRETFIGGRLGPTVSATVSIGEAADVTYAATIVRGATAQNHRIKYGRGLKSRYWSFGLQDTAGSEINIDTREFDALETGRKI